MSIAIPSARLALLDNNIACKEMVTDVGIRALPWLTLLLHDEPAGVEAAVNILFSD